MGSDEVDSPAGDDLPAPLFASSPPRPPSAATVGTWPSSILLDIFLYAASPSPSDSPEFAEQCAEDVCGGSLARWRLTVCLRPLALVCRGWRDAGALTRLLLPAPSTSESPPPRRALANSSSPYPSSLSASPRLAFLQPPRRCTARSASTRAMPLPDSSTHLARTPPSARRSSASASATTTLILTRTRSRRPGP